MDSRQILHGKLVSRFPGIKVYYQPPSKLTYPCIVYDLDNINTLKANNKTYKKDRRYVLTYYSLDPDPKITINNESVLVEDVLLNIPMCSFDRHYVADGIHHYVFTIFY